MGAAWGQPSLTFQLVGPTHETERITGIYCSAPTSCVVATDGTSDVGHVYASDGSTITETLLSGDYAFAETFGTLGTVDFFGFSRVGDTLIVQLDSAANAWVTASGDITQAASWTATTLGTPDGATSFGGNQQLGRGVKDGRWVFARRGAFYESADAPGAGALWFPLWSPTPPGEVPSNLSALVRDDPRLCTADPGIGISPKLTQMAYVAPDLAVIVYPAGARNQGGSVGPGVCISVDGGQRFHHVPFPELEGDLGPLGVTWTDATSLVRGLAPDTRLHSVFVLDAEHVWIGGEGGVVMAAGY